MAAFNTTNSKLHMKLDRCHPITPHMQACAYNRKLTIFAKFQKWKYSGNRRLQIMAYWCAAKLNYTVISNISSEIFSVLVGLTQKFEPDQTTVNFRKIEHLLLGNKNKPRLCRQTFCWWFIDTKLDRPKSQSCRAGFPIVSLLTVN